MQFQSRRSATEPVRGAQSYPAVVKQVVQSLSLYALESIFVVLLQAFHTYFRINFKATV